MEMSVHTIGDLFDQLGLPSDKDSVDEFIASNRPICDNVPLADAGIWTPVQSEFIRESLESDADWAELVDQLDALLRTPH